VRISVRSRSKRFCARNLDVLLVPLLVLAAAPMSMFRAIGPQFAPASRAVLRRVGVWPLRRHYYDPLFHPDDLSRPLNSARAVGGIDWQLERQLALLKRMRFSGELRAYLTEWILKRVYQWNEQYILEAFLSFNTQFDIIGALNLLHYHHYPELAAICVQHDRSHEPGSFYIQRRVP
jgi:hypothetical protein